MAASYTPGWPVPPLSLTQQCHHVPPRPFRAIVCVTVAPSNNAKACNKRVLMQEKLSKLSWVCFFLRRASSTARQTACRYSLDYYRLPQAPTARPVHFSLLPLSPRPPLPRTKIQRRHRRRPSRAQRQHHQAQGPDQVQQPNPSGRLEVSKLTPGENIQSEDGVGFTPLFLIS